MLMVVVRRPGSGDGFGLEPVLLRHCDQQGLVGDHVVDESVREMMRSDEVAQIGRAYSRLYHEFSELVWILREMLEAQLREFGKGGLAGFERQGEGSITAFVSD